MEALLKKDEAMADLTDQAEAKWDLTRECSCCLSSGRRLSSGGPVRLEGADKATIGGSTVGTWSILVSSGAIL